MEQLLNDPEILRQARAGRGRPNRPEGVGAAEAPARHTVPSLQGRRNGLMTRANLMIATGQNNLAMNRSVLQVAKHFCYGGTSTGAGCSTAWRR